MVFAQWQRDIISPFTCNWISNVQTSPIGASFGDFLSQPVTNGGLGLGTVVTSWFFLAAILALVAYLAASKIDLEKSRRV